MTTLLASSSMFNSTWKRDQLLTILTNALMAGEKKYARKVAMMWLAVYPGDLQVRLIHARSLLMEENSSLKEQARNILEDICLNDPEYIEAQKYLAQAQRFFNPKAAEITLNCILALGGSALHIAHGSSNHPNWALQLRETRRLLLNQKSSLNSKSPRRLSRAESLIHQVLVAIPQTPLAAVTHLRVILALGSMPNAAVNSVAKVYLERWPRCLPIMLIFAHTSMDNLDATKAVAILHRAASMDVIGQVPERLWGKEHPYQSLWATDLEIKPGMPNSPQNIPVPAGVASAFGWNRLSRINSQVPAKNQTTTASHTFEHHEQQEIRAHIEYKNILASKRADNLNREGRFPIYVVFSTRTGLIQQYGAENLPQIEEAMQQLVNAVRGRHIAHQNWGAMLFMADDPRVAKTLGIKAARHNDPWSLKLSINDLDQALASRGERIGALIIIGGHEVVPFHHLPNPVDDVDNDVPSDNPYATRDENYFVLEWPVGRLPGGASSDPTDLIHLLHNMAHQHQNASRKEPWYKTFWAKLRVKLIHRFIRSSANIGYSAAVWRRASLAVYRSIGDPRSMLVSPPVQACEVGTDNLAAPLHSAQVTRHAQDTSPICITLPAAKFGYFNLHGLSDACEWYGQRDPTDPEEGPDFPIALRPQDIRNSGHAPRIVFSEACYGAYIHGKIAEEAISIKFLTSGTLAVVGSTSTCYGSISSPLIAADLLGRVYWGLISEGYSAGESLRRAKLYLAREMHQRQGFLDGEDQKTLISFVLYGDPLAQPSTNTSKPRLIKAAPELPINCLTVSDQQSAMLLELSPSAEVVSHVKQVVKQYLPGMSDAQVKLNPTGALYNANTQAFVTNHHLSKNSTDLQGRQVVILSKSVEQANLTHQQLARLTLDTSGKLVKIVVSR